MAKKAAPTKKYREPIKYKLKRLLYTGWVITDHTGPSIQFLSSTQAQAIEEVCAYHRLPWAELQEICKCVRVEVYETEAIK